MTAGTLWNIPALYTAVCFSFHSLYATACCSFHPTETVCDSSAVPLRHERSLQVERQGWKHKGRAGHTSAAAAGSPSCCRCHRRRLPRAVNQVKGAPTLGAARQVWSSAHSARGGTPLAPWLPLHEIHFRLQMLKVH